MIFKAAVQNFSRNFWLSVASIAVIFLMIFPLGFFFTANIVINKWLEDLNQKMNIEIYLNQNANRESINLLRTELENLKEVKELNYVSEEKTLKQFAEKHQDNPIIKKSLEELKENPFGPSLQIKLSEPQGFPKITEVVGKSEYQSIIYNKDFYDYEQILKVFENFKKKLSYFGLIVGLLLIFIAVYTIYTTIRIAIYSRAEEIKIMRLVGAKNSVIQGPFLIEGGLYGFLSWGLFFGLYSLLIKALSPPLQKFFGFNFNLETYTKTNSFFFFGSLLIFSLFIAMLSSWLATKKYLKG